MQPKEDQKYKVRDYLGELTKATLCTAFDLRSRRGDLSCLAKERNLGVWGSECIQFHLCLTHLVVPSIKMWDYEASGDYCCYSAEVSYRWGGVVDVALCRKKTSR